MTNSPPVQAASAVEREAIVAWLLKEAETLREWSQVQAVRHYAHRIERGDHLASLQDTPDAG